MYIKMYTCKCVSIRDNVYVHFDHYIVYIIILYILFMGLRNMARFDTFGDPWYN